MFRRRREGRDGTGVDAADGAPTPEDLTPEDEAALAQADEPDRNVGGNADTDAVPAIPAPPRPGGAKGPYDAADSPQDELHRMDFGSLRVPVLDGMEVRFDLDETGQVAGFVLADGDSVLQLAAFAAPKRSGLWDEIRAEMVSSLGESGGEGQEVEGPFGKELQARIATGVPGELAPARFVGVDQPRWFLRGLLSGPAAIDPAAAERLLAVFGETVVDRGSDAMPLRDMLPLALPAEVAAAAQQAAQEQAGMQQGTQQGLAEPLGPGPTITETR